MPLTSLWWCKMLKRTVKYEFVAMSVKIRKIAGNEVFALGYGAMGIGFNRDGESDEQRFKVLDAAYDAGCKHWDTANVYGDSEELLGKWFKRTGKRSEIFLASKFGFDPFPNIDGTPENAKKTLEEALKKLQTDYIDLYYLHRPDPKVPIEATVGTLAEFVKQGKIRYIGISECSAETLRRAHAIHPIAAIQMEYSPFTLDMELPDIGVLKTARELGVAIVAYSPLGRGILTGRYKSPDDFEDDFRRAIPRYSKANFPKVLAIVDAVKKIGDKHGVTSGQVTLAWLLAQGDDIIPIPGTTKVKYLKENLAAVDVKLSQDEIAEIRQLAENAEVLKGERYPWGLQKQLFADTPPLA
ncbi:hypothetical protein ACEPAF_2251 [Sanghuangporus sanghuang]